MIKIFGIGLNKTGTTTLAKCLDVLGCGKHVSCRGDLLAKFREGSLNEIFSVIDQNNTFEDWPWPLMYRELFFRYGDSARYILTKRSSANVWLESLKRHSLRTPVNKHCHFQRKLRDRTESEFMNNLVCYGNFSVVLSFGAERFFNRLLNMSERL